MSINSLREQLLKAGLVTAEDVKRADRDKSRSQGKKGKSEAPKPKPKEGKKRPTAKKARRPKPPQPMSSTARIVELYRSELVPLREGDAVLNFVALGSKQVRQVELCAEQHQSLVSGNQALVSVDADLRNLLAAERTPQTFGRRTRRVYAGGPATSTPGPNEAELGLLPKTAAEQLLELDRGRVFFFSVDAATSP